MGEKLLAFEFSSIHKQLQELLATRLAFGVVVVLGLSFMVLIEECVFLAIHAQRWNVGKFDLIPALRTHIRLCEVELCSESQQHPTIFGANIVPRDLDVPLEHDLANFLVDPQDLAVLPPLGRGILYTKRDLWSESLFECSLQLEQVTAKLIRKEQPHLRVHLAVATRQSFEKLREQVFPVPVFRNEVHEVQNHVGKELV